MNWLNIHTDTLRSEEYLGAEPVERATWLNLMAWCASQENGGVIVGADGWGERKWMQLCGITQAESAIQSRLYSIGEDGAMVVSLYPMTKEDEVRAKREAGKIGGKSKSEAKLEAAKLNGAKGGRPTTQAPPEAVTQAEPKQEPNGREGKGREREGKEKGMEGKKAPPVAVAPPLPHGSIFAEAWETWQDHRNEIKHPLKPTMAKAQLKRLGAMSEKEAVEIIQHTVEMGWQGLRGPEAKNGQFSKPSIPRV